MWCVRGKAIKGAGEGPGRRRDSGQSTAATGCLRISMGLSCHINNWAIALLCLRRLHTGESLSAQLSFSSFLSPCVACCTHGPQKLSQLEKGPHGGHQRPPGTRRAAASTVSVEHRVGGDLKQRRGAPAPGPGWLSIGPSRPEIRDCHSVSV